MVRRVSHHTRSSSKQQRRQIYGKNNKKLQLWCSCGLRDVALEILQTLPDQDINKYSVLTTALEGHLFAEIISLAASLSCCFLLSLFLLRWPYSTFLRNCTPPPLPAHVSFFGHLLQILVEILQLSGFFFVFGLQKLVSNVHPQITSLEDTRMMCPVSKAWNALGRCGRQRLLKRDCRARSPAPRRSTQQRPYRYLEEASTLGNEFAGENKAAN